MLAQISQHGLQILDVEKQHALVIRHPEQDIEHPRLGIVQPQHAGQKQRAHFAHRSAHGMPLLAVYIPEHCGIRLIAEAGHTAHGQALSQGIAMLAGPHQAAQVALYIRQKHRHAHIRKALSQHLEGHRLARARRTGDQSVAVGHLRQQAGRLFACANPDFSIIQHRFSSLASSCFFYFTLSSPIRQDAVQREKSGRKTALFIQREALRLPGLTCRPPRSRRWSPQ